MDIFSEIFDDHWRRNYWMDPKELGRLNDGTEHLSSCKVWWRYDSLTKARKNRKMKKMGAKFMLTTSAI